MIGDVSSKLTEGSLTNRGVLRVYFHYRLVVIKDKKPSVKIVAEDLISQQKNLGITSLVAEQDVVRKINIIIDKYMIHTRKACTSILRIKEAKIYKFAK